MNRTFAMSVSRRIIALVRIQIYGLLRWVRLTTGKYWKYDKVVISKANYVRAKNQPLFVAGIQLSRLINSIRSAQRILLRIPNNGSTTNTKDRTEMFLYFASIVFEALKTLNQNAKHVKTLRAWAVTKQTRKYLDAERGNTQSMYNRLCGAIRNKVMFHYDELAIQAGLNRGKVIKSVLFAIGKTTAQHDIVYAFADSLLTQYGLDQIEPDPRKEVDMNEVNRYLFDLSEKIISVASELIVEIVQPIATYERGSIDVVA